MNRAKWRNPNVPLTSLALKLAEEVGEVATEVGDMHFVDPEDVDMIALHRNAALAELEHVQFIAKTLKKRLIAL